MTTSEIVHISTYLGKDVIDYIRSTFKKYILHTEYNCQAPKEIWRIS